jgi:hypothetical protein
MKKTRNNLDIYHKGRTKANRICRRKKKRIGKKDELKN